MANSSGAAVLIAHNVYFTLNESNAANREALLAACRKYLVNHPGVVFFAVGTVNDELARPVNDRNFDVGLHVVFQNKAAHDAYQVSADHVRFIEENRANWKQVRVFDSDVEQVPARG